MRLDAGVAYLAANISLPFVAPFITFGEIEAGALLTRGSFIGLSPHDIATLKLETVLLELIVGTAVVAPIGGAIGGATTYALVSWRRRRRRREGA